jgi:peroxiredoxin
MLSKTLFLTTISAFCFRTSIAQKAEQNGFIINGHIDGIENGTKVYLYDLDAEATIDSATSKNSNFTMKGHIEKPTCCWIRCKDQYAIIQLENTKMEFSAPLKDMNLYNKTKGGKEQDLQNELTALQQPYDVRYLSAYDSLINNRFASNDHKKRLIKNFNDNQSASQNIFIEFGKRHPASFLGLDILYRNRQRIGKDTVKSLLAQMPARIRSTAKAQALDIFVHSELAQKGKPFIDFEAQSIEGTPFRLSSLKGNYILLSFWSAGCVPCRMENRKISKDYERLKDKLSIVSFSTDKNQNAWVKASKEDKILWPNISDLAGDNGRIKTIYDVQAIPTCYLINKEGIIIEKFIGFDEDFINQLEKLIDKK